jgi:chemotaxis protein CheX
MATTMTTNPTDTRMGMSWPDLLELAAAEVFQIMLASQVSRRPDEMNSTEFTVTVGLSGELRGLVGFHCSGEMACKLASKMLQAEIREFNEQSLDAIGEMCNMVAGNLKAKLPGVGDRCSISTPTIISGSSYYMHNPPNSAHYAICLDFQGKPMWITLDLQVLCGR